MLDLNCIAYRKLGKPFGSFWVVLFYFENVVKFIFVNRLTIYITYNCRCGVFFVGYIHKRQQLFNHGLKFYEKIECAQHIKPEIPFEKFIVVLRHFSISSRIYVLTAVNLGKKPALKPTYESNSDFFSLRKQSDLLFNFH